MNLKPIILPVAFGLINLPILPLSITSAFDAVSRYKEYLRFKDKKVDDRILYSMRTARCQRNVMCCIHGDYARKYYYDLGYRWYHILPDALIENPLEFFTWKNLKRTYFK